MKSVLLSILFVFVSLNAFAQLGQCTPDATYQDSAVGVYPLPYDPITNPNGGITKSACKNHPYQFIFNVVVPDTVNFPGFGMIPLNNLSLVTTGAFSNLPKGLNYACNPPNCIFLKNTVGCVSMFGTVDNSVAVGDYELIISGTLATGLGLDIPFTFPNAALYPGTYILKVEPENSSTCYKVATSEVRSNNYYGELNPNPVANNAIFNIFSKKNAIVELSIMNLNGINIFSQKMLLQEGKNIQSIDASNFPNGVYLYKIYDNNESAVGKMVVQH